LKTVKTVPVVSAVALALFVLAACDGGSPEKSIASARASIAKDDGAAAFIQLKSALEKNPNLAEARFLLAQVLLDGGDAKGGLIELDKARELGYPAGKLASKYAQALLLQGKQDQVIAEYGQLKLASPQELAELQIYLSSAYAVQGNYPSAQGTIENAASIDPDSVKVQLARVRLLGSSGAVDAALTALATLQTKYPELADAWLLKGQLLEAGGKLDEALQAFDKTLSLNKKSRVAYFHAITLLIGKQDFDGAKKRLDNLVALGPNHPQTRLLVASFALAKKDLVLARENIQQLLKLAPDDIKILHLAGAIEFQRGALLQADSYLSKALAMQPDSEKIRILLAKNHTRRGDYSKAIAVLHPLLAGANVSLDAYAEVAAAYLQQGDLKNAELYLAKLAKLNPGDARSRTILVMLQMPRGNIDQSLNELHSISANSVSTAPDMALITTYLRLGDADKALKAIGALEQKEPSKPNGPNLRGRVELARGNTDLARSAFESALKIDPVFLPAAESLAALDIEANRSEAAIARFKKILDVDPKNLRALMAVVQVHEKAGASKDELVAQLTKVMKQVPGEPGPRRALIGLLLDRKDVKQALAASQDAITAFPDDSDLRVLDGKVQAAAGDFNQALAAMTKAISLQPNSPVPLLGQAELFAGKQDYVSAMQSLKKALSIKSDYLPAQKALLTIQMATSRFSDARSLARALQAQPGSEIVGKVYEGDVEAVQKHWPDAIAAYRDAIEKNPTSEVAIKLHRALVAAGKAADSAQLEVDWLRRHPQDAVFYHYLGDAALLRSDFNLAEQRFKKVLELQPNHILAANNCAWLLMRAKKPGALEYALKAVKLAPNQPPLLGTLAEVYADAGDLDKAIETQKRAVALAPEIGDFRMALAKYYMAAGGKDMAREELNKLRALGDKFGEQNEVRRLLATL